METALSTQKALASLAQSCLHPTPSRRPSFATLASILRSFQQSAHPRGTSSLQEEEAQSLRSSRLVLTPGSTESAELE